MTAAVYVDMPEGYYTAAEIRAWFTLAKIEARLPSKARDVIVSYALSLGGRAFRVSRVGLIDGVQYRVDRQP